MNLPELDPIDRTPDVRLQTALCIADRVTRQRLRRLLEGEDGIELVSQNGVEPDRLDPSVEEGPDVVFLEATEEGLQRAALFSARPHEARPSVVLLGHPDRATDAWEVQADDYLAQPLVPQRLQAVVRRVRVRRELDQTREINRHLLDLIRTMGERKSYLRRVTVKHERRMMVLDVDRIDWIDAARNYVRLNVEGRSFRLRESIGRIEKRLDPEQFARIHRSTIVRVDRIREIRSLRHGEYLLILRCGQRLTLSRGYRSQLDRLTT